MAAKGMRGAARRKAEYTAEGGSGYAFFWLIAPKSLC